LLGGSAATFCRELGLTYQTLIAWRRGEMAARLGAAAAIEFVVLAVAPASREHSGAARVELDLGGGMALRIHLPAPWP
jgi:hypothetical protein